MGDPHMGGPGLGPPMEKIKNAADLVYGVNEQYCFASLFHKNHSKGSWKHGGPWVRPPNGKTKKKFPARYRNMGSINTFY